MKYLDIFKDVLGSIECPEHHEKPTILKDESDELRITTCCPKFKRQCLYLVNKVAGLLAKE